jgi:hypothetical protein
MKKKEIVIVGAGLGGSVLAHSLSENWNITIIEQGDSFPLLKNRVKDTDTPAITDPHICSGLGGTTILWHNGLIEIEEGIFNNRWPFPKLNLERYYKKAIFLLSGKDRNLIKKKSKLLLKKYISAGFKENSFQQWLFYPKLRMNPWKKFRLKDRVKLIEGEVIDAKLGLDNNIKNLKINRNGKIEEIEGDIFVFATGGLSTPILLDKICKTNTKLQISNIGVNYEDHPSVLVGDLKLNKPLFKLWNFPCANGNLRLPLMVTVDGLRISFQLRPSANSKVINRKKRVKSVINELRNNWFNLRLYFRLLTHMDDLMEILSFKFNINLPTSSYSLLMVAEQPPSKFRAIWEGENSTIFRKWIINDDLIDIYNRGIQKVLNQLDGNIKSANIYENWKSGIFSSSHHSGTARMALTASEGVCDSNTKVFGTENLYICDGSVIPGTGMANTGLTIAALGLKLADHLNNSKA